ncbi:hypothetical protein BRC82_05380 [Halobacteriales archaeon QS_1_67_19]|nr:MAG: hypothetical protein BRC82_05380 [Halobacteriales archaeon QS_1_67_19]
MVSPVDSGIVREVVKKARSLPPHDHRVVLKAEHLPCLSKSELSTLLFMAEHSNSCFTPAEKRAFDRGVLEVSLEYQPVSVEEGDVFVHFDIKSNPETRAIRRMGVHTAYTAKTKRRLVEEGEIEL